MSIHDIVYSGMYMYMYIHAYMYTMYMRGRVVMHDIVHGVESTFKMKESCFTIII